MRMNFSHVEQQAVIKFMSAQGKRPVAIHKELEAVCGSSALGYRRVHQWVQEFKEGREGTHDMPRAGRPRSSLTSENTSKVESLILGDRRLTIAEIAKMVDISEGSVHHIITDELKMTKVSARWVPRLLDDEKKEARVEACRSLLARHGADEEFLVEMQNFPQK